MDEIKPTWRFAWGLWWKMFLISLGIWAVVGLVIFLIILIAGVSFLPFLPGLWGL